MKNIVLLDRDGTLIYDDNYHLGRSNDWKKKVKILPGVVKGLKLLKSLPNTYAYIITNQPGVAIEDFKLLTEKRAMQVNNFVIEKLNSKGANTKGSFLCPHASPTYTKKRSRYQFTKKLVCNCNCIKPRLGMVFSALEKEGITRKNSKIYIIGDRASDVETSLEVGGTGILVPFINSPDQDELVRKLKGKKYIAKNLYDAVKIIKNEI